MDFKALDQATDYRALLGVLFGAELKGEGTEVYMVPPSRPDEKLAEMRFSVNTKTGMWKDHKTGESGNMLTLAKSHGPPDWRKRWIEHNPGTEAIFGGQSSEQRTPSPVRKSDFDLPDDLVVTDAQPSIFDRAIRATAASATEPKKRVRPVVKRDDKTFAQRVATGQKMTDENEFAPFVEAWGVDLRTLRDAGAWCFTHTRGALSGKPQIHFPMISPTNGETVGIKKRGLEPIYKAGDKMLKSRNEKGSSIGLFPWHPGLGSKPLLLVEGEKDWAVAHQEYGDRFDVVANLGGASTFKNAWVDPITARWKDIYVCYDNDDAGAKGARKAATLLRGAEREVRVVRLPVVGADLFDMLRGDGSDRASVDAALEAAAPLGELSPQEVDSFIKTKCKDEDLQKDDWELAKMLYQSMEDNGALFYITDRDEDGDAYACWRKKVYRVRASSPGWSYMVAEYTGASPRSQLGTKLHASLKTLAHQRGKLVESGKWTHYDGDAIYYQLWDEDQHLVRITSESISLVPNGWDDIIFLPSTQVPPVEFMSDDVYNHADAERFWNHMWEKLNLSPKWQEMMKSLVKALFMYDFMQTHPVIRFQGAAGSGKSTGQQIMSLMLYGHHDLIGDITAAALYRVANDLPIVLQDDLEDKDIRRNEWLQKFMLRAAMGGLRIKSGSNSDDTVNQEINCWVCTSGIHSIADDTPALNERLIVLPVRDREDSDNRFAPIPLFKQISKQRNTLWNYIYREVQKMLALIEDGAMERVMNSMPDDQRPRLHEFYAIMALARGCTQEADGMVLEWLHSAQRGEKMAVVESSHVSELLFYLPSYLGDGTEGSGHQSAYNFKDVEVSQDNGLWSCRVDARLLHAILAKMSRDTGLRYSMPNARRLGSELRDLKKAGVEDGLELEYDNKVRRVNGRLCRLWAIEMDAAQIRELPSDKAPPESEDPIPF